MFRVLQVLTVVAMSSGAAVAQETPLGAPRRPSVLPPGDRILQMQQVAAALGVECGYCHANLEQRGRPTPLTTSGKPRMEVAREMFLMVDEVNRSVQTATNKSATDATRVQCVTCHRGVAIPKQLSEILTTTAVQQGPAAATAQYRELRTRYYGRQAYDFSDQSVATFVERLARIKPEAAVALMQVNLEFYPKSSLSYMVLGFAQTQTFEYFGAMESFRKALELDPMNNNARGRLAQLESQYGRRSQ
jgi:hypothetical protein